MLSNNQITYKCTVIKPLIFFKLVSYKKTAYNIVSGNYKNIYLEHRVMTDLHRQHCYP